MGSDENTGWQNWEVTEEKPHSEDLQSISEGHDAEDSQLFTWYVPGVMKLMTFYFFFLHNLHLMIQEPKRSDRKLSDF